MTGPAYQAPVPPSQDDPAGAAQSAAAGGLGVAYAAVVFAGDRACKLKKPVALGFLDLTSPRARAVACRREVTLNRRFAPDVYLGVAAVRGPDGRVCDHLLVMRRMPAARRLSALLRAGADAQRPVRQVARVLVAWHAAAPRSGRIAAQGTPEALWRRWEASIGQMAARQAPWPEAVTIDTGRTRPGGGPPGPPEPADSMAVQQALEVIRPPGPEYAWHPSRSFILPG